MVKEVFREGSRCACYTLNKDEKGRRIFLSRHPLSHFQCSKQCVDVRNFLCIVNRKKVLMLLAKSSEAEFKSSIPKAVSVEE